MKKHFFLLLTAVGFLSGKSVAQDIIPCKTSEMTKHFKEVNPMVEVYEKKLNDQIKAYISRTTPRYGRTTSADFHPDTAYYDIPVVVHVMHNYGREDYYLSDNRIYELIKEMNRFYNGQSGYSTVVSEFRPYIGIPKFRFYLATKDPSGNPTNGITRRRTYLTYGADEQAKMDQWPPTSYVNIWFENVIGRGIANGIVVAYATPPASGAGFPPSDGIISNYSFINDATFYGTSATCGSIDHEMGHIFNLEHTFGKDGDPHHNTSGNCGDDDDVDDTPPCEGNLGGCNLTDTVCSRGYFKTYPSVLTGVDSLVNYPDTANEQNVMNYADCKVMFTKGQVVRMRAALNSDVAGRNNLWDSTNLVNTGVGTIDYTTGVVTPFPRPDLKPIPEFAAFTNGGSNPWLANAVSRTNYGNVMSYFTFPGTAMKFLNATWNDTVTSITWTFPSTAATPSITQANPVMDSSLVINSFTDPGWVSLTMKATGNNSGDTTVTWPRAVFVADANATPGYGYIQNFSGADTAKWPSFNYFGNNLHWQMANVGRYDNNSMEYVGYDDRLNTLLGVYPSTGTPKGDIDDLFTVPFDLTTGFSSGHCTMNFRYASASRSPISLNLNDTLEISYSVNKSTTWTRMAAMTKGTLINNGSVTVPYAPQNPGDWSLFSMEVPTAAKQSYVVFRFRYKPGVGIGHTSTGTTTDAYSSGNNFYMDDFNFSPWAAGVENLNLASIDMAVVPNPTNGDAYVVIKDASNATADVIVTDITGKVVYTTSQQLSGNQAQIDIPRSAISVSGMYLVRVATGNQVRTEKLVVE